MMRAAAVAVVLVVATTGAARADDGDLPNSIPTVMDRRWSVSMAYGAGVLRPQAERTATLPGASLDLDLRARLIEVLEVGVGIFGVFQRGLGYVDLHVDLRYRLFPERAWNPYLLVGLAAAKASTTYDAPYNDFRKAFRVGGGLERRFTSWAFAGELKLFAIGDNSDVPDVDRPAEEHLADSTVLGGSLSVFATYYWGRGTRTHRLRGVQ